jgi:diadenosine tetraphosphate (Ap4A) HIT family hydrolase
MTEPEQAEIIATIRDGKRSLNANVGLHGHGVGVNVGVAAVQPVMRVHAIPRFLGDGPAPRAIVWQCVIGEQRAERRP